MSASVEPTYETPAGVPPDVSPAVPVPADSGTPSSPAGASAGDGPPPTTPDNRIPYDRFQEVVHQRQRWETEAARFKAEAEAMRQRLEAIAGLQPATPPPDPQEQAIREQLERMYPSLKRLQGLNFDQIETLLQTAPELQAQAQATYNSLANESVAKLYDQAKDLFGGQALSPAQQRFLHRAFVDFVETDPANTDRYVRRDPTLIPEFVKAYAAEMLDPVRRAAAVTVGARVTRTAAAPTGGGASGPVGTPPPQIPKDEDSLHDAAWEAIKGRLASR